jgi:DNA-directed RNA polymerase specialized sigma24 family protein
MTPTGSITRWIGHAKDGDEAAVEKLWQRYFQGMVELARQRLRSAPRRAADEEDVALSAFHSFCLGARNGRFPRLTDRDSLWPLLVAITAHKAVDLIRRNNRQKRGGLGRAVPGPDQSPTGRRMYTAEVDLHQLISRTPDPEFALQIAEDAPATPTCVPSPWGRWRARPPLRSRPSLVASVALLNASSS